MELVHKAKQNLTPQLLEAFLSALLALSPGACSPWLPERLRSALFALTASVRWSGVQLGGWVHACSEVSVELRGWVTLPGLNVHGFNRAGRYSTVCEGQPLIQLQGRRKPGGGGTGKCRTSSSQRSAQGAWVCHMCPFPWHKHSHFRFPG